MTKKKKKKKSGRAAVEATQRQRPAPPPPPPASLVQLLQHDSAVLQYFRSLQANLEADVTIWKKRALQYKQEKEQLEKELAPANCSAPSKRKKLDSRVKNRLTDDDKAKPPPREEDSDVGINDKYLDSSLDATENDETITSRKRTKAKGVAHADGKVDDEREIQREEHEGMSRDISDSTNDDDFDDEDDNNSLFKETKGAVAKAAHGEAIDDAMFDFDSSSSEEGDDLDSVAKTTEKGHHYENLGFDEDLEVDVPSYTVAATSQDRKLMFELLKEAWETFRKLGIVLVKERVEDQGRDGDSVDTSSGRLEKVIARRNEDVAAEICYAIRSLTRFQLEDSDMVGKYPPFSTGKLIPCCNHIGEIESDLLHPAVEGKRLLFRALLTLDTFCIPQISREDWSSIFADAALNDDRVSHAINIGTYGRKKLIEDFIQSVDGEIRQHWACVDRAERLNTTALHYDSTSTNTAPEEAGKWGGNGDLHEGLIGGRKSQGRLSLLIERSILAQVVVGYYLSKDDILRAWDLLITYILATVPVPLLEDCPRLPPVLSFVVVESIIHPDGRMLWWLDEKHGASWLSRYMQDHDCKESMNVTMRMIALCMHLTAAIWEERSLSADDRIRGMASVEVASYKRIMEKELKWMGCEEAAQLTGRAKYIRALDLLNEESNKQSSCWPLRDQFDKAVVEIQLLFTRDYIREDCQPDQKPPSIRYWYSLCKVRRHRNLRLIDNSQINLGSEFDDGSSISFASALDSFLQSISNRSIKDSIDDYSSLLMFSWTIADGASALKILKSFLQGCKSLTCDSIDCSVNTFLAYIRTIAETPVVRFINLERRRDRNKAFVSQAQRERILSIRGVARIEDVSDSHEENEFGGFAFDGGGRLAEAEARLSSLVGSIAKLNEFVSTHWRPNDLKPFDRNAPDHCNLVRMTPSERACALSHVACWKGILRSLELPNRASVSDCDSFLRVSMFHFQNHVVRACKISGFASGRALLPENEHEPPAPVCVVLEDDAVLVDRFAERLASILRELPRDFHFCSLGYSRPKSAPIVPCDVDGREQPQIGIPSMQWYLTGYILSERGAQYLLESLPVVGPIDTWIGLKMTSNWDNVYGEALGVGKHAKVVHGGSSPSMPSRKDLRQILRFRAYCALHPLCSQKVGITSIVAASRDWRQRDTDIEYSGDKSWSLLNSSPALP